MVATDEFRIHDQVVRIAGGQGYTGALGQIFAIKGDRLRVFWHTPASGAKPKQTWVNRNVVRLAR